MELCPPTDSVDMAFMMHLVLGWGFRSEAKTQSFASCWRQACQQLACHDAMHGVRAIAMLESKRHTSGGQALGAWACAVMPQALTLPLQDAEIQGIDTSSQSARVLQRYETGSVSEALAVRGGQLLESGALVLPEIFSDKCVQVAGISLMGPRIVSADRQATLAMVRLGHVLPFIKNRGFS